MSGLKLKLNLNTGVSKAPSLTTPLATPGGSRPTIKLKNTSSVPSTPAPVDEASKPKKTKAGRTPKSSAKLLESRKRPIKEETDTEEDGSTINVLAPSKPKEPATKKIKLQVKKASKPQATPITPVALKLKSAAKGKKPQRLHGEGYDSEASDREDDPVIEEEFILRMVPGDDCDFLRRMINEKRLGIPRNQGGPDIQMRFFQGDGRRAAVTIRGNTYAATLVDLPCVIEGMKSWDKRGWWKSADICQMLWVFAPIKNQEEAKTIALPSIVDQKTFQYPHGLTPPMHYARKRRFRKRLDRNQIEAVEAAVERLLDADQKAESTSFTMFDPDEEARRADQAYSPGASSPGGYEVGEEEYSGDEDAEGEVDDSGYFGNGVTNHHTNGNAEAGGDADFDMDADLEADLEAAMEALPQEEAETPMSTMGETPAMIPGETPAAQENDEEDSGDESIEDEEEGETVTVEVDPEQQARLRVEEGIKEDIKDLEKQLSSVQYQLRIHQNPLLRKRLEESARKINNEIDIKKMSLGEAEDNDDDD
jgi:transcription initiation factor TFIID subunit 7